MAKLNTFLKLFTFLCCGIALVNCECHLSLPTESSIRPSYEKFFGRRTYKSSTTAVLIDIQEGERIKGFCATTFSNFTCTYTEIVRKQNRNYYNDYEDVTETKYDFITGQHEITLSCKNSELYYSNGHKLKESLLRCADLKWGLYESARPFHWCQLPMGSYVLSSKYTPENLILSAACVDVERMTLQTLQYFTEPQKQPVDYNKLHIMNPNIYNDTALKTEIQNTNLTFSHISTATLQMYLNRTCLNKNWMSLANYEYHSIVQGGPYLEYFNKFGPLLDIIWWSNLRNYNWKRFMDALNERTGNFTYNLYAGTSGAVHVPLQNDCKQRVYEELKFGDTNQTIPAYIWTYVQATTGTEEFVFVGYNSPFFDFFDEKDIIFCQDICDQIVWLNDIRSTFRYTTLGVTFCCSVEEVLSLLKGFPDEFIPETTTITDTTTSTTEMIESTSDMPIPVWVPRRGAYGWDG